MNNLKAFWLLLLLTSITSCSITPKKETLQVLKIYHTNDVHAHYMPNAVGRGGLAYLTNALSVAQSQDKEALLVDVGDFYKKGSLPAQNTNDQAMADLWAWLPQYDVRVVGNNEVKAGLDQLFMWAKKYERAPLISANLVDKNGKTAFEPYIIFKKAGLNIGIIGITHSFEIDSGSQSKNSNAPYKILDPEPVISKLVTELRPKVDVLILASHTDIIKNKKFAIKFPQIDLVLSGHSHVLTPEGLHKEKPVVVEAGQYGLQIGVELLTFNTEKRQVVQIDSSHWPVGPQTNQKPNIELQKKIDEQYAKLAPDAHEVLAEADQTLTAIDDQNPKEGLLLNWMADLEAKELRADFAFVNRQMIREEIQKGKITREFLLMSMPYPGEMAWAIFNRARFEAAFDRALQREWEKSKNIAFGVSKGSIQISGTRNQERINVFLPSGEGKIKVAMPFYIFTHCEEFFEKRDCPLPKPSMGPEMRMYVLDLMKREKKVKAPAAGRVRIAE
jgi:2',3'-cyclic-nucleotide 2'-phosphodiesterase (5'-nucleotidase family)